MPEEINTPREWRTVEHCSLWTFCKRKGKQCWWDISVGEPSQPAAGCQWSLCSAACLSCIDYLIPQASCLMPHQPTQPPTAITPLSWLCLWMYIFYLTWYFNCVHHHVIHLRCFSFYNSPDSHSIAHTGEEAPKRKQSFFVQKRPFGMSCQCQTQVNSMTLCN